jgi:hypothetical protein
MVPHALLLLLLVDPGAPLVDGWRSAGWEASVRQIKERSAAQDTILPRALELGMSDPDPRIRALAAWGLSLVGTAPAVPALRVALRDRDPEVRWFACYSIGRLHADSARADLALLSGSFDQTTWLGAAVREAQRQIDDGADLALYWGRSRSLQTPGLEAPAIYQHPPVTRVADAGSCRSSASGVAELLVDHLGYVPDVRLLEPLPCAADNQAYLESARSWRFRPARFQGQAVPARVIQRIPVPE